MAKGWLLILVPIFFGSVANAFVVPCAPSSGARARATRWPHAIHGTKSWSPLPLRWQGRVLASSSLDAGDKRSVDTKAIPEDEADVVVIGSGISGLCAAALLATYGKKVIVCESHTQAGGCAHGFERGGYKFDSGPSLFSGTAPA
ncbi:unnamed protein product [Choristocarpus tenellus]